MVGWSMDDDDRWNGEGDGECQPAASGIRFARPLETAHRTTVPPQHHSTNPRHRQGGYGPRFAPNCLHFVHLLIPIQSIHVPFHIATFDNYPTRLLLNYNTA